MSVRVKSMMKKGATWATSELNLKSLSQSPAIKSLAMNSSGSVKMRYEKCLQIWGNAIQRMSHTDVRQMPQ